MSEFLASNDWQWRLLRTIMQGMLGVVIALELGLCERRASACYEIPGPTAGTSGRGLLR